MKRYIEIVYDNSGSMNGYVGKKTKYQIAQELFEKEILPTIARKGDHVVLRLLGTSCNSGRSHAESLTSQFGTNRKDMLFRIKQIRHDQLTPLFYTIYDSIEACKKELADQYLIFVLTDGDDTCGVKFKDLISEDLVSKYVKFYNVLLVQLAVESTISRNNLTSLTSYLGGQTISLGSRDTITTMRSKMKKALNTSGFSLKLPLAHCFDSQPGFDYSWEEIEETGIDFHQALLLFNKKYLTWEPQISKVVSALELAELKFLFGLCFKSGFPDDIVKTMLSQLKQPYYYSFDCIYWDFSVARWKYFKVQNTVEQMDNPDAQIEDGILNIKDQDYIDNPPYHFNQFGIYEVESDKNAIFPVFVLKPSTELNCKFKLKPGDVVEFVH